MNVEEKLMYLYEECIKELKSIGIDVLNNDNGEIYIRLAKRNNKRYGCCKQELPDKNTKYYEVLRGRRYVRYAKYNKHTIEISKWVMELEDEIIKNTIIHEMIHCMPYCNNHGEQFKKYAKYINDNLGYNISRVGNKKQDYEKSHIDYEDTIKFNYKVVCNQCNQTFYRQRIKRGFLRKYRCGKCGGKFIIFKIDKEAKEEC